jgi:hypothetical protein
MIWQWRANKGLPYAEDMKSYELLLSKLIAEDTGQKAVRMGGCRPMYKPNTWPTTLPGYSA